MIIRREFLKCLAGLPFLGFLREKTEDEKDVEESLESLKEPGGVPLETFVQTLGTSNSMKIVSCHCEFDGGLHKRTCRFPYVQHKYTIGCYCPLQHKSVTNIIWSQRMIE